MTKLKKGLIAGAITVTVLTGSFINFGDEYTPEPDDIFAIGFIVNDALTEDKTIIQNMAAVLKASVESKEYEGEDDQGKPITYTRYVLTGTDNEIRIYLLIGKDTAKSIETSFSPNDIEFPNLKTMWMATDDDYIQMQARMKQWMHEDGASHFTIYHYKDALPTKIDFNAL